MFYFQVAEEERRIEQERMHVFICSYFQLDPKLINEHDVPFFVDPYTGQWHARDGHKVPPPRSHVSCLASSKYLPSVAYFYLRRCM